MGELMLY